MRALSLHPSCACAALRSVEAEIVRPASAVLELRYVLAGAIDRLVLPPPAEPLRADELWRRTCLEAFLRAPEGEGYLELNLSPSTAWAAYGFDGYRAGMQAADPPAAIPIELAASADRLELTARVDLTGSPRLDPGLPWRAGLSAVIVEQGGRASYWALAHPPGRPDFHHPDCFGLELPAPGRP